MEPKTLAAAEEEKLVEQLCSEVTCACALAHPSTTDGASTVVANNHPAPLVVNFSPTGFLATLRQAAVDVSSVVGLFARARLESCTRTLARGWGPAGPGRYERRSVHELVDDKIYPDLNLPAEDDPEVARERRRKRNLSSDDLGGARTGARQGRKKRNNGPPPCTTNPDQEPMDVLGGAITGPGEELDQEEAEDGSAPSPRQGDENDQADIRQRLEELITKANDEAKPYQSLLGKLYWFRKQLAKDQADHGGSAVQSAQPEVRRPEIGWTSAAAATMRQEQIQDEGTPRLSHSDNMETLEELHSMVKSQAKPFPTEHYLGKLNWFRSLVAKDDCGSAVVSTLPDQPATRYNDEGIVEATESQSHMNVTSAQIGTSATADGNLFPMHGDGSTSSQPAGGNEDKASEDVHAVPGCRASLQVMVPDVIPRVRQPSPARVRQLEIANSRREPDNLDRLQNDLDENQPGPSSSASAPP